VPEGHAPFAVWNRTGNRAVAVVLRSPLHPLISRRLALISVTGRRSGREHTFPVAYTRDGERVSIVVGWPERKLWWRNLREGGPVRLRLQGQERIGHAHVEGDERASVTVEVTLDSRGAGGCP
jgi:F420H(2)-dependent quinone reductase